MPLAYHCPACNVSHPLKGAAAYHAPRLTAALAHLPAIRAMEAAGLYVDASLVVWNFGAALQWAERHAGHGVTVTEVQE